MPKTATSHTSPEELIGSIEIMTAVITPNPEVYDWRASVFVAQQADGWQVVGFASDEPETCLDAPQQGDFMRHCDIHYFVHPWALGEEVRSQEQGASR